MMVYLAAAAVAAAAAAPSDAPRAWRFPADDGAHPEYRTEWWYFAGSLAPVAGDPHAFHLAFFRRAVAPDTAGRRSRWAARDVYVAHLSITNERTGERVFHERALRGALGMAGARTDALDVRVEPWKVFRWGRNALIRLQVFAEDVMLDVPLQARSPRVLHGDSGLVRKGPGAASHYTSIPRMGATAAIRAGGRKHALQGFVWFDHEFMNEGLPEGVSGWDWFGLHLDDGSSLMVYLLRRPDGTWTEFSGGTHVSADSVVTHLAASEIEVDVTDRWRSRRTLAAYPAGWRVRVPRLGLDLSVAPTVADQEFVGSITGIAYWEGSVRVSGSVAGRGMAELTGYAPGGEIRLR